MPRRTRAAEPVTLFLCLVRTEETALATNGLLNILPRPDLPPPPPPFNGIEKSWLGNAPNSSRIPPQTHYRLCRTHSELWECEVIGIFSAILKKEGTVVGRENEEIALIPTRDIATVPNGSIGVVEKHTGPGRGYAPDPAFATLCQVVFSALDRGERVLLEIRS